MNIKDDFVNFAKTKAEVMKKGIGELAKTSMSKIEIDVMPPSHPPHLKWGAVPDPVAVVRDNLVDLLNDFVERALEAEEELGYMAGVIVITPFITFSCFEIDIDDKTYFVLNEDEWNRVIYEMSSDISADSVLCSVPYTRNVGILDFILKNSRNSSLSFAKK